jgi:hypothetical protein
VPGEDSAASSCAAEAPGLRRSVNLGHR